MEKEEKLGGKFWLWFLGVGAALVVGLVLLFTLVEAAWYRWGAFGTMLFFFAVILIVAWFYDRRQVKNYYENPGGF